MVTRTGLSLLILAALAWAEPVETQWALAARPPAPTRVLSLHEAPPAGTRTIEAKPAPRYTLLQLGSHSIQVAVNPERIWIDRDGDRQFADTEASLAFIDGTVSSFRYAVVMPLGAHGGSQTVPMRFELEGDEFRFGHGLERAGEVELLERVRPFRIRDGNFDLRFHDPRQDFVLLDVDGDALLLDHEGSHERALVLDPIPFGEVAFRCRPHGPEADLVEFPRADVVPKPRPRVLPRAEAPPSPRRAPGGGAAKVREILDLGDGTMRLDALGRTGAAFAELSSYARSDQYEADFRARAVAALGYDAYADQGTFLERMATGPYPAPMRIAALRALHDAGVKGRELIYAQLLGEGQDESVFLAAAQGLAWSSPRMASAALGRVTDPPRRAALYRAARGEIGPEVIVACAKQRYAPLRAMALRDVFLLGHPQAYELAVAAALEPQVPGPVLEAAIRTLGGSGRPEAVQIIFELATLGVHAARTEGRRLLALDRRERVVTAIAERLESPKPEARRLAITLLGQIPTPAAGQALAGRLGKEKDPVLDRLVQTALLAHAHPRVVRALAHEVRRAKDVDVMEQEVEKLVARGQRHKGVRAALIELLEWRKWEVKVLILRALTPGRYPDLARACAACLEDRVWQVRLSAAEALGRFRVRDGVGPLVAALRKEEHARVRSAIAETLEELTGEKLREFPELWERWWDREGAHFELAPPSRGKPEREAPKGETKTVATFYGIPVTSNRVIFVLDRSGSMARADGSSRSRDGGGTTRIQRAKDELRNAVKALPNDTRANVVFFGTGAFEWRSSMVKLNRSNRRTLDTYLDGIDARGGTDMYDALALALEDDDVETIFLLSDGNPTGRYAQTPEMLAEVAKLNRVRRVQIHTIALNRDSRLMALLAEKNGGTYKAR